MIKYRKLTSFLLSLLVCAAAFTAPAANTSAEGEDLAAVLAAEDVEETTGSAEVEDNNIYSGDLGYVILDDGTAKLTYCASADEVIEVPSAVDGIAVTSISRTAFADVTGDVKKITIPASVTDIDEDTPFVYLSGLEEIETAEDSASFTSVDGVLFTKDMSRLLCYPRAKSGDAYTIPEGVTELGYASMSGTKLKTVTMPSSLTKIGSMALSYNDSLTRADMSGSSVTDIISEAFEGCSALTEVLLPDTLTSIGGAAFWNCSSLTEIDLPEGLLEIEQYAFAGAPLKRVYIPNSVSYIGYYALGYLSETETVEGFTLVGDSGSYAEIYATESDEEYDYANNFTFMTTEEAAELEAYEALDTRTSGDYEYAVIDGEAVITAFLSTGSVVEVPSEIDGLPVTRIYTAAFASAVCGEVIIPESVKTIDKLAFYGCTSITSITIKGAETIGDGCFEECSALTTININGSCRTIEGGEPFSGCRALREINITGTGVSYSSENGVLYNSDKTTLIAYPAGRTDKKFTAPKSVKTISQSAFYNAENLESVDISHAETIAPYAFENCTKLTKVKLSKGLLSVGQYAFLGCTELKGIRVYSSLRTIGDYAFGFRYDAAADTSQDPDAVYVPIEGFRLYTDEDTLAYQYAQANGITAVTGTVPFLGYNVDLTFLIVVGSTAAAALLAVIGVATGKSIKKKREEREKEEARAKAAARRAKKKETDTDEK
ncbi:MAG: leucine-rich repeat domain-containing protein [Ruminococcus sp.]|nr:leucine-rich repeat domain-containing protein [Ruminococcus sp.]